MNNSRTNVGNTDFVGWMVRLLTWEGILPTCVFLVRGIIETLFPSRGTIEAAAVVLPITFFFVRIFTGCRHIDANHCSQGFQRFQVWALVLAVFVLVFVDAIMILADVMPNGALVAGPADWIVIVTIILIYLVPMSVAMYPGRSNPHHESMTLP